MSDRPIKMGSKYYQAITDEHIEQMRQWLMKTYNFEEISTEMLKAAIDEVAKKNSFNSLDLKMSREDRAELFRIKKATSQ